MKTIAVGLDMELKDCVSCLQEGRASYMVKGRSLWLCPTCRRFEFVANNPFMDEE